MVLEDIVDSIRLTDTMNWNLIKDDFELAMNLEPEGCFSVFDETGLIGLATSILFERLGWIGNVIVDAKYREKGIGSLLMREIIDHLKNKGVTTIGLYSYMDTVQFYERLGFKKDKTFLYLVGRGFETSDEQTKTIELMSDRDFDVVLELDKYCIGVSRERLLRWIYSNSSNFCFKMSYNGKIKGFGMAKLSKVAEIGPIISAVIPEDRVFQLLEALLRKFIGFDVYIGMPVNQFCMASRLRKHGFHEEFRVLRMYYGDPLREKGQIIAIESLERG